MSFFKSISTKLSSKDKMASSSEVIPVPKKSSRGIHEVGDGDFRKNRNKMLLQERDLNVESRSQEGKENTQKPPTCNGSDEIKQDIDNHKRQSDKKNRKPMQNIKQINECINATKMDENFEHREKRNSGGSADLKIQSRYSNLVRKKRPRYRKDSFIESHHSNGSSSQDQSVLVDNTAPNQTRRNSYTISPIKRKNRQLMHLVIELKKHNMHYRSELKKAQDSESKQNFRFQQQSEVMHLEISKLQSEILEWKNKFRKQQNQNVNLSKVKWLSSKNQELTEDMEVLKSVVYRLNKELAVYQERLSVEQELLLRKPMQSTNCAFKNSEETQASSDSYENTTSDKEAYDAFGKNLNKPKKYLLPLFVAYDESIKEKNALIKGYEGALVKFKTKCQQVIKENQDLHEIIRDKSEVGKASIEEWDILRSNSVIVLEENDILHETLKVLKDKQAILLKSHSEQVEKLQRKIATLKNENVELHTCASKSEKNFHQLMEKHSRLAEIMERRIPVEKHEASILECKTLFEELKLHYGEERTTLMDKLSSMEKERDRLVNELAEIEASNARLESNIKVCEQAISVHTIQLRESQMKVSETVQARDATRHTIEQMMHLSQRVVEERENAEEQLVQQRCLNERLILLRDQECKLVIELQGKIKEMENIHEKEIKRLFYRIDELESIMKGMTGKHNSDMVYLQKLVKEKEKMIQKIDDEKSQLQIDLETVWKTSLTAAKEKVK